MSFVRLSSYPWQIKRGSILMVSLWILIILTLLAIGVGWRTSCELRFVRIQRDRLKAFHLAKAGIKKAIVELEKDTNNNYDSLNETWSTGLDSETKEPIFENIEIKEGTGETFTVRYFYREEKGRPVYLCMADEERKININTASKQLLITLLEKYEINDAQELANDIHLWRGDQEPGLTGTPDIKFKKAPFSNPEELVLVLEYFYQNKGEDYRNKAQEVFNKIKDLITVYGSAVNVNTASDEVLTILANSVAKDEEEKGCVEAIVKEITRQKEEKNFFGVINEIVITDDLVGGTSSDLYLFNNLKGQLTVKSNHFRIESTGNAGQVKKKITAVVKRGTPIEIVYWNES